mmetsp:Transcript_44435/g.105272  ORF Transcript_44435/g.105272 Transcript_44435/m.105272 type:complete len:640 (+) Transcript_44435:150-2069(+)
MDVDEDNFEEALQCLENALEGAAFVAMDLEMTGIRLDSATEDTRDLPEDRYVQQREVAARHGVVQIGLCIFEEAPYANGGNSYYVYPFNFYLFPRPFNDPPDSYVDAKITLDADAVHFMRCNGMDFGRWMTKGIPYVNRPTEKLITDTIAKWRPNGQYSQGYPTGLSQKEENQRASLANDARSVLSSKRDRFDLTGRPLKVQQSVLQDVRGHLPKQHFAFERRAGPLGGCRAPAVSLCKLSQEAPQRLAWEQRENQVLDVYLKQQIGFRRAWKALCSARRPLVVHNGFLDLLFAYHWLEEDLPETMDEFQQKLAEAGIDIYDTKWIASYTAMGQQMGHGQRTSLEALCNLLDTKENAYKPHTFFPQNFAKYTDGAGFHDAGFDAYCTGRLFAYFKHKNNTLSLAPPSAPPNGEPAQEGAKNGGSPDHLALYKAKQRSAPDPFQGANPFVALECSDDEDSSEEVEGKAASCTPSTSPPSAGSDFPTFASSANKIFLMFNSWDFRWGAGSDKEGLEPILYLADGKRIAVRYVYLQGRSRKDWTQELFEIAREHTKAAKDAPPPRLEVRWGRRDQHTSYVLMFPENKSDVNWQDLAKLEARLEAILRASAERTNDGKGTVVRWDKNRRTVLRATQPVTHGSI